MVHHFPVQLYINIAEIIKSFRFIYGSFSPFEHTLSRVYLLSSYCTFVFFLFLFFFLSSSAPFLVCEIIIIIIPRPSRDSFTKEGLVSNVRFPGFAESACERELCNST